MSDHDDAPPATAAPTGPGALPRPRKRFGQHFLRDARVLRSIADALALTGTETVIEIGPGRGALTDLLVPRARRLIAIEIDRDLAAHLRARYADAPHVTILAQDVLETDLAATAGGEFVLAGNVPYYITTPIIFHALQPPLPRRAVYLVQREVADRIGAPAGGKEYGALSVNVQAFAEAEVLLRVPPGAFHPPPKVDSAVLRLTPRTVPAVRPDEQARFQRIVQEAFGLRRKQLRRVVRTIGRLDAVAADAVLARAALDPEARPETLSPEDFARLVRAMAGGDEAG
jgi:16S rRNA (adenine1518-N6/adenine1519-N6)-dimethyltransferase